MKIPEFFQRSELAGVLWALRREFLVSLLFTAVINLLMLTPTLYMLQVFDRVMASGSELTLLVLTLFMVFLFAVMAFSDWIRSRLLVRTGVRLDAMLNSRVFNASFEARLKQLGQNSSQALNDLITLRQFLTGHGLFAFLDLPWAPIYIGVLYLLHPSLGVLGIVFVLILVGIAWYSHRRTTAPLDKAAEAGMQVNGDVHGKLRNTQVIEAMGMLDGLRKRWLVRHQKHLALHHEAQDVAHRMQAVTKFVRLAQQSLSLGFGALLVIDGLITPGAMVAINALMSRATGPVDMMVSTWKSTLAARQAFLRLEKLLAEQPARATGLVHGTPQGHLQLDNLVATAPGRAAPILKGITADFPAGNIIVVLGPSGSGKSTLARTLVGIWPETSGKVLIDGEPIQSWDRDELGPYIGYLPQDIELFDGTIAENIARFGSLDSNKIIEAAKRAGVHEMILRFSRGYDTPMGEAGGLLSGGQRQRIGLARAMYDLPSLVVLDEPNANLDDAGEAALLKAVLELKQEGRTVFLISHRLSVVNVADRLLILSDGQIQDYGTRQDVIQALQARNAAAQQQAQAAATVTAAAPQPA